MTKVFTTLALTLALTAPAFATPGALNAKGCHGKRGPMGYHCHSAGESQKFVSKNQRFVPGHFSRD